MQAQLPSSQVTSARGGLSGRLPNHFPGADGHGRCPARGRPRSRRPCCGHEAQRAPLSRCHRGCGPERGYGVFHGRWLVLSRPAEQCPCDGRGSQQHRPKRHRRRCGPQPRCSASAAQTGPPASHPQARRCCGPARSGPAPGDAPCRGRCPAQCHPENRSPWRGHEHQVGRCLRQPFPAGCDPAANSASSLAHCPLALDHRAAKQPPSSCRAPQRHGAPQLHRPRPHPSQHLQQHRRQQQLPQQQQPHQQQAARGLVGPEDPAAQHRRSGSGEGRRLLRRPAVRPRRQPWPQHWSARPAGRSVWMGACRWRHHRFQPQGAGNAAAAACH
mmetsp:Transcript_66917/g.217705  ORF Transcript_66917/g.217705 Transcript_66917/m.217705 type:complete len:329 (-) Transcript_66917:317-1303(-)